jgi:hypothetical protein
MARLKQQRLHSSPLLLGGLSSNELVLNYKKVIKSKKVIKESFEFHDNEPTNDHHDDDSEDDRNSIDSDEVTLHLHPNKDNLDVLP